MKLIIGLGNVGEKYKNTRHNAGFMFVDELSSHKSKDWILTKSGTMMNSSGLSVHNFVGKYKLDLEDLYIVHDDLDLPLGEYKIQKGRGPKVHNGIKSVESELGSSDFWRVRIGIDNRDIDNRTLGEIYVLQDFNNEEKNILEEVFPRIARELQKSING